jgi:hypothetical protein
MYRHSTRAKIPLIKEQTPKQKKDNNEKQVMQGEVINRRERVRRK